MTKDEAYKLVNQLLSAIIHSRSMQHETIIKTLDIKDYNERVVFFKYS